MTTIIIRRDGSAAQPLPQPLPSGLRITGTPLPALGNKAPYSSNGSSKHTNMATDGKRIYVSGGDWTHSATDGTWSCDMAGGDWRQDIGEPVYPTLPAPHALQDGAGFEWVASRGKFLLWPGSYFAYDEDGSSLLEYAKGMWWFDPATNTYEQDLRLFGVLHSWSGCPYGGAFDEVNGHIVVFGDSSGGFTARRWGITAGVKLTDILFTVRRDPKLVAAYFTRGQYAKIGRDVFILGYRTDGTLTGRASMMLRWNLDAQTMTEVAAPPFADMTQWRDLEIRTGVSRGKLIWPRCMGPEGDIDGVGIYDPQTDVWTVDDTRPDYGNFIDNALCSLPDGRVAMCGGSFGKQQTHFWFIEAT